MRYSYLDDAMKIGMLPAQTAVTEMIFLSASVDVKRSTPEVPFEFHPPVPTVADVRARIKVRAYSRQDDHVYLFEFQADATGTHFGTVTRLLPTPADREHLEALKNFEVPLVDADGFPYPNNL